MKTAIIGARVFDGERVLGERTVVIEGPTVAAVGGRVPDEAAVVDARGATLLPGLIDAHTHTSPESLALALRFGVTTELEMQGRWSTEDRREVAERDDVADLRSAGFAITPSGGHPSELFSEGARPGHDGEPVDDADAGEDDVLVPFSSTPEEATAFVPRLVASGSDYIKFMIDDGSIEGAPGLPMLDRATLEAGVVEAHRLGMLTVAHALTIETTRMAIEAGIDGVMHVFMDGTHTDEIVDLIAESGAFVVPCVVLDASMMGITGEQFAADPRVGAKLPEAWLATLRGSFDRYPQGRLDDVLGSVGALHDAGVDVLAGTDVSVPVPFLGGLAHGASLHHELQMLVAAGLTPVEALRAATSVPTRRFGLSDRGRVEPGARADLLLVDGDPATDVANTLSIREVWRRGVRLATH